MAHVHSSMLFFLPKDSILTWAFHKCLLNAEQVPGCLGFGQGSKVMATGRGGGGRCLQEVSF